MAKPKNKNGLSQTQLDRIAELKKEISDIRNRGKANRIGKEARARILEVMKSKKDDNWKKLVLKNIFIEMTAEIEETTDDEFILNGDSK